MSNLYNFNQDPAIDEFGVDHSDFSVRDELEYNKMRLQEKEQQQSFVNRQNFRQAGQGNVPFSELKTTDIPDGQPLFNTGQGLNQQVKTDNGLKGWLVSQIPTTAMTIADDALNLYNKKREMEQANQDGYDNYAHRLAMCENAQNGPFDALVSLGGGIAKEAYDLKKKIPQQGFIKPIQDSIKDMSNNIEGLQYGLTHPFNDCRKWLNNLDIKNNIWKK